MGVLLGWTGWVEGRWEVSEEHWVGCWGELHKGWVFSPRVSPPIPSSSSLTVLASFSASSLSFFSSSRECFSSALAPAPILGPAALRLTRSLEVSTRMGNELQPPAASSARLPAPSAPAADCPAAATAHPMWAKDGAKVLGGRPAGCCAQHPWLKLPPLPGLPR